jgi:hypothetical protein
MQSHNLGAVYKAEHTGTRRNTTDTMEHTGKHGDTVEHNVTQWNKAEHNGTQQNTMEHSETQWNRT